MINLLPDNDLATLWIPPPRYSDRLNVSDESREPRCYVGIQIVEAKVVIYLLRIFVDVSLYFLKNKCIVEVLSLLLSAGLTPS